MKIAIISDSHDNLPNINKVKDFIAKEGIKTIIHCGDVVSPATLKESFSDFKGKFFLSLGNGDFGLEEEYKISPDFFVFDKFGEAELKGIKIAFSHYPGTAKKLAETGKYNIIFYGHTHKPWEKKINECCLVNPGTLSGMFYKATFAVLDTESRKIELKIL